MLVIVGFREWRKTGSLFLLQESKAVSYPLLKNVQPAILTPLLAFSLVNLRKANNSSFTSTTPSSSFGRNRLLGGDRNRCLKRHSKRPN